MNRNRIENEVQIMVEITPGSYVNEVHCLRCGLIREETKTAPSVLALELTETADADGWID